MPKVVVCSHNLKSNALKNLAQSLSAKLGYKVLRVRPERVRARRAITFHPGIDKVTQFRRFHEAGVSAPRFSTSLQTVKEDLAGCKQIVARTLTSASEGKGIIMCEPTGQIPNDPLYTEYVPKKKEFRVHVFDNEVVDVAEKRKRRGENPERNTQIRNTANGYVFCRDAVVEPDGLRSIAVDACKSLGRTQGAVDIIYNERRGCCFVLEVNSRPGMVNTTVENYANAIVRKL